MQAQGIETTGATFSSGPCRGACDAITCSILRPTRRRRGGAFLRAVPAEPTLAKGRVRSFRQCYLKGNFAVEAIVIEQPASVRLLRRHAPGRSRTAESGPKWSGGSASAIRDPPFRCGGGRKVPLATGRKLYPSSTPVPNCCQVFVTSSGFTDSESCIG